MKTRLAHTVARMQVRALAAEAGLINVDVVFENDAQYHAFSHVPLSEDAKAGSFAPGRSGVVPRADLWAARGKVRFDACRSKFAGVVAIASRANRNAERWFESGPSRDARVIAPRPSPDPVDVGCNQPIGAGTASPRT